MKMEKMAESINVYRVNILLLEKTILVTKRDIINVLSKEFYVTNGGGIITLTSNSKYKYILLRPTDIYIEMFNLDREVIVLFSDYTNFQSRTLDAFEQAAKQLSSLRELIKPVIF